MNGTRTRSKNDIRFVDCRLLFHGIVEWFSVSASPGDGRSGYILTLLIDRLTLPSTPVALTPQAEDAMGVATVALSFAPVEHR
jgi:hypothetical protein